MKNKTLALGQILTEEEMTEALRLYSELGELKRHKFAGLCSDNIIRPALNRINELTKQENDPKYLAYCVEYAIMRHDYQKTS